MFIKVFTYIYRYIHTYLRMHIWRYLRRTYGERDTIWVTRLRYVWLPRYIGGFWNRQRKTQYDFLLFEGNGFIEFDIIILLY